MNYYKPQQSRIINIRKIGNDLKIFTLSPGDNKFKPGQFYILGIPGFGEAPFTPTVYPFTRSIEFLIRNTQGIVTQKLFSLKIGEFLQIRGPYGNGYPFDKLADKNLLFIAGGCGLAPIKSGLEYAVRHKNRFGQIQLFYGVNTPDEIVYRGDLRRLGKNAEILIAVACPDKKWCGNIGFVTNLIDKNTIKSNSVVFLCGPPVMYKSVIDKLLSLGINKNNIYISLERRMHCGIGVCQHCTCGTKYVCKDGPVFNYNSIKNQVL